jgi:sugar phosphate isomerase/epimerase
MNLSLDCITLTNTTPQDLIRSASIAGFDLVSLWLQPPSRYPLQLVTPAIERECIALLTDMNVRVHAIESFDISSPAAIASYRPMLECGARLGAKAAAALHIRNTNLAEVSDSLGAFVELAKECGLGVNVEPIAMCQTATLVQARDLIRSAGVDAGIVFDVYHLVRTGGTVQDLRSIDPTLIRYVQVNDAPVAVTPEVMRHEAAEERLFPGEGEFPLIELLRAVPTDVPWGIESPGLRRARSGMSAEIQATVGMAAMLRLIDKIDSQDSNRFSAGAVLR